MSEPEFSTRYWHKGEKVVITGATIVAAHRHVATDCLYLSLKDGRFVCLEPVGDCCASAYFCHVNCAEALVNATVLDVQDLEIVNESDDGSTVVDVWGHRIVTTKGICTLDMRTEHNGYYGGSMYAMYVDSVPPDAVPLEDF